jgi:hypothetical protein
MNFESQRNHGLSTQTQGLTHQHEVDILNFGCMPLTVGVKPEAIEKAGRTEKLHGYAR